MTSAPSPQSDWPQMELLLTSSAEASPAKIYPTPERVQVSRVSARDYGSKSPESFASCVMQDGPFGSSFWKTSQRSLVEDSELFSETWPRSGTMQSGIAYQRPPLAPLTGETASGLLPTPEASNTKALAMRSGGRSPRNFLAPLWPTPHANCGTGAGAGPNKTGGPNLQTAVKMWPTPRANDSQKRGDFDATNPRNGIPAAAKLWATPTARDFRSPGSPEGRAKRKSESKRGEPLTEQVGGQLNPTWVEWLMGFPPEWTACMASATRSSRKSRKS